jgi:two-component system OmpR family response regulator/two-component system response regulator RstA
MSAATAMNAATHPLVVLVEDDVRLADLIRTYLETNGFRVSIEHRGDRGIERIQREKPDLIVLDVGLPGRDGFAVCREVRTMSTAPILMLTARNSDIDHVLGLELGADDYVIKPVEPRVLVARLHALMRRGKSNGGVEHKQFRFGQLHINCAARSVMLGDQPVTLSSNEFDLLVFLASRADQIQSRDTLYQQLYRRSYDGIDRTLDVRISHLRRKLGDTGNPERIRTVWGHGYLFVSDAWGP